MFLYQQHRLFAHRQADMTRGYLAGRFGVGVNLPVMDIEEACHPGQSFRYVLLTYSFNRDGLHLFEGVAKRSLDGGNVEYLEASLLYIFEGAHSQKERNEARRWVIENVSWVHELVQKQHGQLWC